MKLVTFNRAMRGIGNPQLLDELVLATLDPADIEKVEDWPTVASAEDDKPRKPQASARARRLLGQTYLTK